MFSLYKRALRYARCNVRFLKIIHTKSFSSCHVHPRIYSIRVTPIRTMSLRYEFNIKNTTIELRKKLEKLNMKLENDSNISLYSMNYILWHPCFKASQITKSDCLILLKCCNSIHGESSDKRAEFVWRIWEKIKNAGFIDLDTYHNLLMALRDTGTYVDVKHILNCLQKDGFSPTAETYTLLLECVCENQNFDDIEFILSAMKSDKHEVNETDLNAILFATAKSRGLDSAEEYLNSASKNMNSGTYTSLLRGIAEIPDSDCFIRLFNEARDNNIEFSIKDRVSIVRSLMKGDFITFIPNVLGPRDDWKSRPVMLCNLIARCLCIKNYPAVYEILNYMGDIVDQFTLGNDILPPCRYVEFLIAYMVRSRMPLNYILQYCSEKDAQFRLRAAAYASLRCNLFDDSLAYFKAMKAIELPIRPHFFWPLLLHCRNEQNIFDVLNKMNEFDVDLDYDTAFKYVMKRLNLRKPNLVEDLIKRGIPERVFITPLVAVAIQRTYFSLAMALCHKYKSLIDYEKLYFILATSLLNNPDFDTVSQICSNDTEHLLKVFHHFIFFYKNNAHPSVVEKFLNTFRRSKTSIFKADLNELRVYLKLHNLDEEIWLDSLVNEVNKDLSSAKPHLRDMNIEELEEHIIHLRKNNYFVRQALRRLLIMHAEVGNVDRAIELKKELETRGMQFSLGMKIALLKVFCLKDDFKEAYDIFVEMKSTGLHEKLSGSKFLMLANTAAKESIDAMYEILKSRTNIEDTDWNRSKDCCRIISTVTEYHGVEPANELFEFLINNNYSDVKIMLLGPIMKYYFARDEIENATLACLKYANRYRLMPMKKAVICKLATLTVEEKFNKCEPKFQLLLDKVLLTSGYLHGSSSTNLVYILCLAEMGLLASLKHYLLESFTGIDETLLWHECSKLSDQNKEQILSNLESVFKDTGFNMEPIYISLIKIYCRRKDLKSARELLKSLEESKRVPSVEFLNMFAELQNGDDSKF